MNLEVLYQEIEDFSKETHGSSDYHKDEFFVMGKKPTEYAPLKYLVKKIDDLKDQNDIVKKGFILDSCDLINSDQFTTWFERQFSRKLLSRAAKKIYIVHLPENKRIFDALEQINKSYEVLRAELILINGKKMPVQMGEWFAKCIFGLKQVKSTSQRGFDFYLDGKRTEVKVHWADHSSPKGVKLRKSLVDLSESSIIIYLSKNFMIREICFLDSEFILRKFSGKGHTIFLKDSEISQYFFSKSSKHYDKVVNSTSLLKFSSPTLAMHMAGHFGEG